MLISYLTFEITLMLFSYSTFEITLFPLSYRHLKLRSGPFVSTFEITQQISYSTFEITLSVSYLTFEITLMLISYSTFDITLCLKTCSNYANVCFAKTYRVVCLRDAQTYEAMCVKCGVPDAQTYRVVCLLRCANLRGHVCSIVVCLCDAQTYRVVCLLDALNLRGHVCLIVVCLRDAQTYSYGPCPMRMHKLIEWCVCAMRKLILHM